MFGLIEKFFIGSLTDLFNGSNLTKCIFLVIKNVRLNLLLLIKILMNAIKDYITINLWLIQINVSEVEILFMTYLIPNKTRIDTKCIQYGYWNK